MKLLVSKLKKNEMIRIAKWGLVIGICLFAFLYCLYYAETIGKYSEGYTPDEGNYIAMAKRLLTDHVYSYWGGESDAYVSPGFPIFLTVCMMIFGTDLQAIFCIKVIQCILASLTVLLTFLLAYQLTHKYSAGIIACLLIALNGSYAFYSRFLLTETFYYFTMMLFFVVFVFSMNKQKKWLHCLSGALFCISIMVRPLIFVIAPFIFIPWAIKKWKKWKELFTPIIWFAVGFVLIGMPWWIRNLVTMERLIIFATQTNPIYAGLAPDVNALGLVDPGSMMGNLKLLFQLLVESPLQMIYWMFFGKFDIMFMHMPDVRYFKIFTELVRNITVYIGLFGMVRALLSPKMRWASIISIIYLLSSFLFIPTSRYSLQYLPILAVFTGYIITKHINKGWSNKEVISHKDGYDLA
jgi:hypothetical protein